MCPLVYRPEYNIDLAGGLQRHHLFDGHKWGKVFQILTSKVHKIQVATFQFKLPLCLDKFPALVHKTYQPSEATEAELLLAHEISYVRGLKNDARLAAKVLELTVEQLTPKMATNMDAQVLRPMRLGIISDSQTILAQKQGIPNMEKWKFALPNSPLSILSICYLSRFQTGGTILAAQLAMQNKSWAINIGGGFHHSSGKKGGSGFCVYADISIALNRLLQLGAIKRAMIVDLDAHQACFALHFY